MRAVQLSLIAAVALALAPATAPAATLTCGQVITEDTRLDNDLLNCPGTGIFIDADNVTLDLNGHFVDGVGAGTGGTGVLWWDSVDGSTHSGITVRNGTIRQFGLGMSIFDENNAVRSVTFESNGRGVFVTDTNGYVIANSTINGSTGDGIFLDWLARGGRITGNTITGNRNGIFAEVSFVPASVRGNLIAANRLLGNRQDGIHLDYAVEDTLIEGNVSTRNADDGIEVGTSAGPQSLGANSVLWNGDAGIVAPASATDLGGNQAQGNGAAAQCVAVACDKSGRLLFGDPIHGPSFSQMSGEAKRASPFALAFGGTVNRVAAFIDGAGATTGTQKIRALLYGRSPGGGPGELLARSFEGSIRAGAPGRWVPFWFVFPPKLQPGLYWIGLQTGQTGGVARFAWTSAPTSRWFNIDNFDDAATSPFGPSPVDDQRMSIYASGSY